MRSAVTGLVGALLAVAAAGCARDSATLRWVDQWRAAERVFERGDLREAISRLEALEATAPAPADVAMLDIRQAKGLASLGRRAEAFRVLEHVARTSIHEQDRAKARYEQARVLEAAGLVDLARPWYRRIVVTYPELVPGMRSLDHLARLARRGGPEALNAHLQWTKAVYDAGLDTSRLGDNLIYNAARVAYERWVAQGRDADRDTAHRLLVQIHRKHYLAGVWDDALWTLSHIARRSGWWLEEIDWINKIQGTREVALFVGNYETPYYWVGQLRKARRQMGELADYEAAAQSYAWFLEEYDKSRWRDDVLFWQGCAYLRLGRDQDASASFARISTVYAESKYLRRLDAARSDPFGPVCQPRDWLESEW